MTSFIHDVLSKLFKEHHSLSQFTFILPSRRAGLFLKHTISEIIATTEFAPKIISIEEFVEDLSNLKAITNNELLFKFYSVYLNLTPKNSQEPFEVFSKWAQIVLQDFNEIDRYLIPQNQIFDYLKAIQEINHWSLSDSKLITSYLTFWNNIKLYYNAFKEALLKEHVGYQGLIYREAVVNLDTYVNSNRGKKHLFIGFNALNSAEDTIIQNLLKEELAEVFWDIDEVFLQNPYHDAGLFIRNHKKKWSYYANHEFKYISKQYSEKKSISIYGIPKNIGQAKYIGTLLKQIKKNNTTLTNTAVILSDENLLIPVLNAIPESINAINVTMGFPLKSIPLASLFEKLFNSYKKNSTNYYYKDVIGILSHEYIKPLLENGDINYASKIIETITRNNLVYITIEQLLNLGNNHPVLTILFSEIENNINKVLKKCFDLIFKIKDFFNQDKTNYRLELEYLFRFNSLFNELDRLNKVYKHINTINAFYSIYKELLSSETLDFKGEPLKGLQIMGMLESRVIDFETVIISSVNEGILPAGKSNNSFIPFDVKVENDLPTFKEKDAVYTYHFYRLLQRAKTVIVLYNTEIDVLTGGEKSRFINQLELENIHKIEHKTLIPEAKYNTKKYTTISKTEGVLERLKAVSARGFSPSTLTNYIRNPIDYYYQSILEIEDYNSVEETVAANTLGNVIHNTLEALYTPFIKEFLTLKTIESMVLKVDTTVELYFKKEYKEGDIAKGKNLIIFEIAKRYVKNFLRLEKNDLKKGNTIKIEALEQREIIPIQLEALDFPVYLKGTVDRIDTYNGTTRIIDYKTGKVEQRNLEITHWDAIADDYKKYSKSFQVLAYAYILNKKTPFEAPVEAGVISFKNLNSGFIKFAKKEETNPRNKSTLITNDILNAFEIELKKLILEICNPEIDFIEKDIE
ncbi:PD-(D/E)XK nuclease family protein [Lacinutrix salivirga]